MKNRILFCALIASTILHAGKNLTDSSVANNNSDNKVVESLLLLSQVISTEKQCLYHATPKPATPSQEVNKGIIPFMMMIARLEIPVPQPKDYDKLRNEFVEQFKRLSLEERTKRMQTGTALCDDEGYLHEAFRHLTDTERNIYFKQIDTVDLEID